jgi:hypothetical protein
MVMVFGQMNEPPGSRFRVGMAALTMAEYFRDDEHRDVLLLIDNIFRFIQAGMEVSGLMGQMPSRLGEVFTRRLREMDGKSKEALGRALRTAPDPGVVRSTFAHPADQRAVIHNGLNETFSAEVRVRFETAPDLVGGIELTTNGLKVAWSIADYLASMENDVAGLLKPATAS